MKISFARFKNALIRRRIHNAANRRWRGLSAEINEKSPLLADMRPVIFFNASTRLQAMSLNAAYSLLTALGLRSQGVPVIQLACDSGMLRCVLGSQRDDYTQPPPCKLCVQQSQAVFNHMVVSWFDYQEDEGIKRSLDTLSVEELAAYIHNDVPLGYFAVNSLRWVLRRHTLLEDESTRAFLKAYILSAWNIYAQFSALIRRENPRAVVVFNGMFFPEAAVRHACLQTGVRVITHEVGLRPFSAFFTCGEATAYPMEVPADFSLSEEMDKRLDTYLDARLSGDFTMAGIRFWPEMQQLSPQFVAKAQLYKRIVPVFTNVIFDTSQVHANTIFRDMFDWLENVRSAAARHPEILFIIRAHPDECRPGKESRESVAQWVENTAAASLPNVVFFDAAEYVNSYELIRQAHLVMVYNSTIGLEAALLGKPVLAGGKARFTQLETAFFPANKEEYNSRLEELLMLQQIETPEKFKQNARRFLYYQLFVTSLDFQDFLEEDGVWKGYVRPKDFAIGQMTPEHSVTMQVLYKGIVEGGDFTTTP